MKGNSKLQCSIGTRCDRKRIGVAKKTVTYTRCSHELIGMLFDPNFDLKQEEQKDIYQTENEDNSSVKSNHESLGLKYNAATARWIRRKYCADPQRNKLSKFNGLAFLFSARRNKMSKLQI